MKAARLHQTGGPEVLQLDEVPTPEAGPGQVLVKAHSIGVGIADQLVRTGLYPWQPPLPTIPGIEMSGAVAALGAGVTGLREGDPVVLSAVPERSCYAEFLAADANWVFPCADSIDLADAGCLMNYRVAYNILHAAARARPGDTVAIVGAAGGVGSALVQLANAAELTTIALVRRPEKAAFAKAQGADHVIDTRSDDLKEQIMAITDGRGVDLFVDPVGGAGFVGHLDLLAPVGMLVLYGLIESWPPDAVFRAQCERMGRSPAVRMFSIHAYDDQPEVTGQDLARLMKMIKDGAIKPAIHAEFPLGMAAEAHTLLDGGTAMGKILLQPERTEPHFAT
ncbi:MAG: zinc-binding dehydrogenase [Alphaproteobacteria bacterium]|nr:zinc-binding dehydrogenase [Alphaproteobacteria bacterium]